MKRCPKCSFLYLDSDQLCDLDQTPLVADDTRIEVGVASQPGQGIESSAAIAPQHWRNWKSLIMVTAAGLVIGLVMLLSYQKLSRAAFRTGQVPQNSTQLTQEVPASVTVAQPESAPLAASSLDANRSVEVNSSSAPVAKASPLERTESGRLNLSSRPVSTGGVGKTGRGPVTIRLSDGSSLQADEVWRTKAGIWYRRKGMVTLLKPSRVKAVEDSSGLFNR